MRPVSVVAVASVWASAWLMVQCLLKFLSRKCQGASMAFGLVSSFIADGISKAALSVYSMHYPIAKPFDHFAGNALDQALHIREGRGECYMQCYNITSMRSRSCEGF